MRRRAFLLSSWGALACLIACTTTGTDRSIAPSPIFGGQGATVAKETPLPEASSGDKPRTGPCAAPSPPSDVALLDDFEDGDPHLFKGFERDGWWWVATDATEGAKVFPEPGKFAPDRLPAAEATKDNLFSAHFKASGQTGWGATWGVGLQWERKGIRCPLNASAFTGLYFRAKGPGTVRVNLQMPETQAATSGGTCTSGCYDFHSKVFFLSDRWADYFVPWTRLQQGGWGVQARFDPARLVGLSFSVKTKDLPVDFWVDDVAFVTAHEAEALALAEHAQPAAAASNGAK